MFFFSFFFLNLIRFWKKQLMQTAGIWKICETKFAVTSMSANIMNLNHNLCTVPRPFQKKLTLATNGRTLIFGRKIRWLHT